MFDAVVRKRFEAYMCFRTISILHEQRIQRYPITAWKQLQSRPRWHLSALSYPADWVRKVIFLVPPLWCRTPWRWRKDRPNSVPREVRCAFDYDSAWWVSYTIQLNFLSSRLLLAGWCFCCDERGESSKATMNFSHEYEAKGTLDVPYHSQLSGGREMLIWTTTCTNDTRLVS